MNEVSNADSLMSGRLRSLEGTTYLVTEDLPKIIENWCEEKGKPAPGRQFFDELLKSLCKALQDHCFPRNSRIKVVDLPRESFAEILDRQRSSDAKRLNEFWVSLDRVYADIGTPQKDGFHISITRFVDKDNGDLSRGPRPESPYDTIEEQVLACGRCWRHSSGRRLRPVVLVDDGAFTGKTIEMVLEMLANEEMYVDSVRLGVAKPEAVNVIAEWQHSRTKHSIRFLGCLKLCPPAKDWVCQRDFFPGVPLSGRVLGEEYHGKIVPVRGKPSDKPVRKPYLVSWGSIKNWANITKGGNEFTKASLDLSVLLWEELERIWEQEITISDLEAIPWQAYRSDTAEMQNFINRRWIDVLRDARRSIPG
jgi:hypothetical protein